MSFDLTLWRPSTSEPPSLDELHRWMLDDGRFANVSDVTPSGFEATTAIGGRPWAAFSVEEVGDLDEDDEPEGPPDHRFAGIRFEMSYSTPAAVAPQLIRLVAAVADHFGLVVVDEQVDPAHPAHPDAIDQSWTTTAAHARALFDRDSAPPSGAC